MIKETAEMKERMEKEEEILRSLNNPMIIKHYNSFLEGKKLCIVMELAEGTTHSLIVNYLLGGTLADLINSRQLLGSPFSLDEIYQIIDQLIYGLKYLHTKGIVHRDIKPENIFLTKELFVKFGDFGLASRLKPGAYTKIDMGSEQYVAPETLDQEPSKLEPDIWYFIYIYIYI